MENQKAMILTYNLTVHDHVTWHDYQMNTPKWRPWAVSIPVLGRVVKLWNRWMYARDIRDPANAKAIGQRSLEVLDIGLREFTEKWDFISKWSEIDQFVVTHKYIFLAHALYFAHIIPSSAFTNAAHRNDFIILLRRHISYYVDVSAVTVQALATSFPAT